MLFELSLRDDGVNLKQVGLLIAADSFQSCQFLVISNVVDIVDQSEVAIAQEHEQT